MTFTRACEKIAEAHRQADAAMQRTWPVGELARLNTKNQPMVRITMHGCALRVQVRNLSTDRLYWIYARRLIDPRKL